MLCCVKALPCSPPRQEAYESNQFKKRGRPKGSKNRVGRDEYIPTDLPPSFNSTQQTTNSNNISSPQQTWMSSGKIYALSHTA